MPEHCCRAYTQSTVYRKLSSLLSTGASFAQAMDSIATIAKKEQMQGIQ